MNRQHLVLALAALSLAIPALAHAAPRERARGAASPCPPGFAALQNSDTCVRVSGRVRADSVIGSPRSRSSDSFETRTSGRVQLDVRKPTEYGPLRAVIRVENRP
jgi:hypothetical protein